MRLLVAKNLQHSRLTSNLYNLIILLYFRREVRDYDKNEL